ncbi:PKD domain-containing protein [Marinilabiliaceae bacterium JC017]|nr:PKD domain-containing protein [Marinilabiliaceae bacterium JC017]
MKKILLLLVISITLSVTAQNKREIRNGVYQGVIRVKFKKEQAHVAQQIEQRIQQVRLLKSAGPVIVPTGIPQMDALNQSVQAVGMKRVFHYAGKHEARLKAYGLDLWYELEYNSSQELAVIKKQYQSLAAIEYAEGIRAVGFSDEVVKKEAQPTAITGTNDPWFNIQWNYENTGQNQGTPGSDISLLKAWAIETGHPDVVVSVVDEGIDLTHPDLVGNIWVNKGEIPGNNKDDDGNGFIDDVNGFNFITETGNIIPGDHGSHVAGTIAAETNNEEYLSGIAGGSGQNDGVRLMSCQIFDNDGGVGNIPGAIIYAANNGAVISQNSWGPGGPSLEIDQAEKEAIDYFIDLKRGDDSPIDGGIVIFAAGNDNADSFGDEHWWPAYYDRVIAVSNLDNNDQRNATSNYGTWVDIAAPGTSVLSTSTNKGTMYMSGTSMACPHVSGVAALIASQAARKSQQITPDFIRNRLLNNTDPIDHLNPGYEGLLGKGRLNAAKALVSVYDPTSGPTADFQIEEECVVGSPLTFTSTGDGENLTYSWHFPQATPETSSDPSPSVIYAAEGKYSVSLTVSNEYGEDTKTLHGFVNVKGYCTPASKPLTGGDYITDVRIGDVHYPSKMEGYSDLRSKLLPITPNTSFELEVHLPNMYPASRLYAWVDWNKNNVFEKTELTSFSHQEGENITLRKTIDVPDFVKMGDSFTMRVRSFYTNPQQDADPCGTYYGETEDYTLYAGEVEVADFDLCACEGKGVTGSDYISYVYITFEDESYKAYSSDVKNYFSFTYDITNVNKGESIWVELQIGTLSAKDHAYGWIDWNRDNAFTDDERLNFPDYKEQGYITYSHVKVTPPAEAAGIYAMRLRNQYDCNVPTSCGSDVYGDVQDFAINIVKPKDPLFNLCEARSTDNIGDDYINRVVINGRNYPSDKSYYTDNTNSIIDLGETNNLNISVQLFSTFDDQVYGWIDWNKNESFDATELFNFTDPANNLITSATVEVPAEADGIYALRVRNQYDNVNPDACSTEICGEVEDYAIKVKKQTITAVNPDAMDNAQLIMFPNPVKDNLTIRGTVKENPLVKIAVYNVSGQQVHVQQTDVNFGEFSTTVNFNGLPAGMYLVKVTVDGHETIRKVFK